MVYRVRSWLVSLFSLACLPRTGRSQYQLVREDPFAQLSSTLQTRQAAACDGEVLGLDCPRGTKIGIQIFQYGRTAPTSLVCPATGELPIQYNGGPACTVSQAIMMAEEMCQGKQSCSIDTGFNVLSPGSLDPCPGVRKYAEVAYKCKPSSFRSRSVCGGDNVTLTCSQEDDRIAVLSSFFSSISSGHIYCPLVRILGFQQDSMPQYYSSRELDLCESASATETLIKRCHGQRSCVVHADPLELGVPVCNDLHVFLKTTYACVDQVVFQSQYLQTKTTTTTTTTTLTDQTTERRGSKYIPEEIKHPEYNGEHFSEEDKPKDIIPHPLEEDTFVQDNQEKIVIALILGVSIGLVGVILIILTRIFRSYRSRANLSSSVVSTPHTDLDTLEYDMAHYIDQTCQAEHQLPPPPDPCTYGTLKKPKGILKNSRTVESVPGSPMSDIVVTYSEKNFPLLYSRDRGQGNTQTLGRNQTFKSRSATGAGGGGPGSTQTLGRQFTSRGVSPSSGARLTSFAVPSSSCSSADGQQAAGGGGQPAACTSLPTPANSTAQTTEFCSHRSDEDLLQMNSSREQLFVL